MADDADRVTELQSQMESIARKYRRLTNELEPTGACHWCGEDVAHPKKFCDSSCAEDYEYEKRRATWQR